MSTRWIHLRGIGFAALTGLLLLGAPALAEDGDDNLTGSVEVLYRSVSQDGSTEKYDEDFDGLDSGGRLDNLMLNWTSTDSKTLDYIRLDASGLGGDPYQRSSLRLGQKDTYELKITHTKQDYLYNLFELVDNEDGAFWNTERTLTNVDLTVHPTDKIRLFFGFQEGERSGDSLFMKDILRDLFRLETPLDQVSKSYTVGANFQVGTVDILFRQTRRSYDNHFVNLAEGNVGLEDDLSALDSYEWIQDDRGDADLTTLKVSTPLGSRVHLTASLFGTFLGEEQLDSDVLLNASGTGPGGTCSVSGGSCNSDADCGGGGDVCVPDPYEVVDGTSAVDLEGDNSLIDVDLAVDLARPLTLFLQYRMLERDLDGRSMRDLDGDGTIEDLDGDGTPGTTTVLDYELSSIDAVFEYRPMRELGLRAGYRTIDRELERDGFGDLRDTDFKSDGDETLILGISVKPVEWFKLNADYEDGDIDQPFNAVAPFEQEHIRVRAAFTPRDNVRIDLGFLDFDNRNTAPDFRDPGSSYDGSQEGTSWSAALWHRASEWVDYHLRYAEQDFESNVRVTFDQAGFFAVEDGNSVFDNDNTQLSGRVNIRCPGPWEGFVRYWMTESDGDNLLIGDVNGLVNNEMIDQEYEDLEFGVTYRFPSGVFVGAAFRDFDYDDRNDLLDYDGQIFTVRGGLTF